VTLAETAPLPVTLTETAPPPDEQRRKHKKRKRRKPISRAEAQRRALQRKLAERHQLFLELEKLPDDFCFSFAEWCLICNFSPRTGRRVLASGTGPTVRRLSEKRIAITARDHRAWLATRARGRA
jgi:hypothetical protein